MPVTEIIRGWKDEEYRHTLTAGERAQLPEHPSGVIEFGQPKLEDESVFDPEGRCKIFTHFTHNCTLTGHCK